MNPSSQSGVSSTREDRAGMVARVQAFDFSTTPLGAAEGWPQSLKTAVGIMLSSRYAMWMAWGPELTFLCNDAYLPTLGNKQDWALGKPARYVWAEVWDAAGPRIERVLQTGEATWDEGLLLYLERSGYSEETYHTFSYSPLADDQGRVSGMLCVVTEETERVIGERRLGVLSELTSRLGMAYTERAVLSSVQDCLGSGNADIPFFEVYLGETENGAEPLRRVAASRDSAGASAAFPIEEVTSSGEARVVVVQNEHNTALKHAVPRPAERAVVLPIADRGHATSVGCLVAGLNPHRPFDDAYRSFLDLLVGQIAAALANARAYAEERRRAESLAELDRAKTAFFSNVSHEFRTPLTLMLGPLEDLVRDDGLLPNRALETLGVVQRNGLRLLKLVNTLLDFSRIEAGRVDAVFEPVDVATLTSNLASAFRSATDRAGLFLNVDAVPVSDPVFVDRDMWEKIVFNLLSNAFKFTLVGGISVGLHRTDRGVELSVRDTGSGIPESELPHIFERFHRIEGARGRTHEGSGIGLALVRELVKLHGGSVSVESRVDAGTTFTVVLPPGSAHLPKDRIRTQRSLSSTALGATPYVEEAKRWVPGAGDEETSPRLSDAQPPVALSEADVTPKDRVVVADDNRDMREYLASLLTPSYDVVLAEDGETALEAIRSARPSLVLADVMMPHVDGFQLLKRLREDAGFANVPVILLSARAGEEATLEGLQAGADDYMVKPFSARDLRARVAAQIERKRFERRIASAEQRLYAALAAAKMGAWEWDSEHDELTGSATLADVFGLLPDQTLDSLESLLSLVHEDDVERRRAALEGAAHGKGFDLEFRIVRPRDGRVAWLEERCRVMEDSLEKGFRVVGLVVDASERKEAEAVLRRSEKHAHFIVRLDDDLRAMSDPDEMAAAAPRLVAEHVGCERALYVEVEEDEDHCNVVGEYSPRHPSVAGRYRIAEYGAEYLEAVRANRPFVEHDTARATLSEAERERYRALDIGSFVTAPLFKGGRLVAMFVVHDPAPRAWAPHEVEEVGLAASRCWESIERARGARALAESEERLGISVQAGELGTFYCPLPLGPLVWNETCKSHFFLPKDAEVTIDQFYAIVHDDDRERVRTAVERAVTGREGYDIEYRTVAPDGRIRWLRAKGKTYFDSSGTPTRFDGVTLDISEVKAAETQREEMLVQERAAREEAERVNRMKDEFLATLSHELRTPLNAILGWSQVLSSGASGAKVVTQGLEAIERNARAQTQMIEDLLDMSRIVSGKIRLDVQTVSLATVAEQAILSVRPMAEGRNVRLMTVLDPFAGPVSGDPARLQQVIWNLLTNAIKFTPKHGQVQVVLERVNSHIELSVADTGEGIEPAFLPHIFGRFQQADASTTRRYGGLGLGLNIVKQLVELHGGSVRVKSPGKGKGSTFTLLLPVAVSAIPSVEDQSLAPRHHPVTTRSGVETPKPPSLSGVAVLVVDDDADARELVHKILSDRGAKVTTAASVGAALDALERSVPTLLVSDIGMPDEDGYALIRKVRELPSARGGKIPAVALTAFARSEDRQRALLAGYQMHVAKPVEPAELLTVCASLTGRV